MQQESVVRARNLPPDQAGELVGFTREQAGWEWMSFVVTRLLPGQRLELRTGDEEMVLVGWVDAVSPTGERGSIDRGEKECFRRSSLYPLPACDTGSHCRRKRFVK